MRLRNWEAASTLLEVAVRDKAPSTLAAILPFLRRLAEATAGSRRGLIDAGVLAKVLRAAGRVQEAENLLGKIIRDAVQLEQFRTASGAANDLINILRATGRSKEAPALVDEMKEYTRRAGLGPWTQLADESMRLQILTDLGRSEEVLTRVEELRETIQSLPDAPPSGTNETIPAWAVRELILEIGAKAAMRHRRWETTLALNQEVFKSMEKRGAPPLEIAWARFNDYGSLLRLNRLSEARRLLDDCRRIFENAGEVRGLGKAFGALAGTPQKQNWAADERG